MNKSITSMIIVILCITNFMLLADPPKITKQPKSVSAKIGSTVSFSVQISSSGSNYVWFQDTLELENSNGSTLILQNIEKANEGRYYCVISNVDGTTISNKALLTVTDGTISGPILALRDTVVNFGIIRPDERKDTVLTEWITNVGNQELHLDKVGFSQDEGQFEGEFQIKYTPSPINLQSNESADLILSFTPNANGEKFRDLNVVASGLDIQVIRLYGTADDMLSVDRLNDIEQINIFPNPTQLNSSLEILSKKEDYYDFLLISNSGAIVFIAKHNYIKRGLNKFEINNIFTNFTNLESGNYQLRISNQTGITAIPICIIK